MVSGSVHARASRGKNFGFCLSMEATPFFVCVCMHKIRPFTGLNRATPIDRLLLQAHEVLPLYCSMSGLLLWKVRALVLCYATTMFLKHVLVSINTYNAMHHHRFYTYKGLSTCISVSDWYLLSTPSYASSKKLCKLMCMEDPFLQIRSHISSGVSRTFRALGGHHSIYFHTVRPLSNALNIQWVSLLHVKFKA